MSLKKYWEKNVVLISKNNKLYKGMVNDYVYPEDNENGLESIIIDAIGYEYPMEFYEDEIKSIEIVK